MVICDFFSGGDAVFDHFSRSIELGAWSQDIWPGRGLHYVKCTLGSYSMPHIWGLTSMPFLESGEYGIPL
jgi:hypothetical protein